MILNLYPYIPFSYNTYMLRIESKKQLKQVDGSQPCLEAFGKQLLYLVKPSKYRDSGLYPFLHSLHMTMLAVTLRWKMADQLGGIVQ